MVSRLDSEKAASTIEYAIALFGVLVVLVVCIRLLDISTRGRLQKAASSVENPAPCGAALQGDECK